MQMTLSAVIVNQKDRAQELFLLADRQAGYFTAGQARNLGYSGRLQHHHRHRGNWLEIDCGLFRLRDYPTTPDEELVKLSLWSRDLEGEPQAVISHETALRLYDLSDLMPSSVHLSVPKGFRKIPPNGVVLHKARLDPVDVEARAGYRVTAPLRTLLDLANSPLSPEHLETATCEALERGLVRRRSLERAIAALAPTARDRLEQALGAG